MHNMRRYLLPEDFVKMAVIGTNQNIGIGINMPSKKHTYPDKYLPHKITEQYINILRLTNFTTGISAIGQNFQWMIQGRINKWRSLALKQYYTFLMIDTMQSLRVYREIAQLLVSRQIGLCRVQVQATASKRSSDRCRA